MNFRTKIKTAAWLETQNGPEQVVVSSRVRLLRNLEGLAFPARANGREREAVVNAVRPRIRFSGKMPFVEKRLRFLDQREKQLLVEQRLLRVSGMNAKTDVVVLSDRSRAQSVVINDEDHIRIQVLAGGLSLETALAQAKAIGLSLEGEQVLAQNRQLGYLTASPGNVGTGLRASVLLHLPALMMTQEIAPLLHTLHHMELSVRDFFGQPFHLKSPFIIISNRVTLGKSAEELIAHLNGVAGQLAERETKSRQELLKNNLAMLEDKVGRTLALVRACSLMEAQEALDWLSVLMLGVEMNLLAGMTSQAILEVLLLVGPASLQSLRGRVLEEQEQLQYRASLVQKKIKKLNDAGARCGINR